MPTLVRGRKRPSVQQEVEEAASPDSSPEPATQRRRVDDGDLEDDVDEAYGDDGDGDAASGLQQLVKKMVRFAMACEYQRRPIRRADISEKVLGAHAGRQFRQVFNGAQVELRHVFGMEMVELPSKEKATVAQRRAAAKSQSQSQSTKSTASYSLISILPSEFRDSSILNPMVGPKSDEEEKYTAAYTVLISLISLSGGSLPENKMDRYLSRLQIRDNAPMGAPGGGKENTEKLLKRMERENYIVKIKETSGTGEDDVYWTVGPRGKTEVGNMGVKGLTKAVYGELEEQDAQELDRRIARSLAVGEAVPSGATQIPQAKKKTRGRKRRNQRNEEDDENERQSASDEDTSDHD